MCDYSWMFQIKAFYENEKTNLERELATLQSTNAEELKPVLKEKMDWEKIAAQTVSQLTMC